MSRCARCRVRDRVTNGDGSEAVEVRAPVLPSIETISHTPPAMVTTVVRSHTAALQPVHPAMSKPAAPNPAAVRVLGVRARAGMTEAARTGAWWAGSVVIPRG